MVQDPVCGMKLEEEGAAAKSEFQGKTFYFCSLSCKTKFDGDPETYLTGQIRAAWAERLAKPLQFGLGGTVLLLAIYFGVVSLISGIDFALGQFAKFWYFIVTLAIGFGIQVALYTYLKNVVGQRSASGKVVAVSGTTSTAAMVSCCVHYLANILPVLGVTGFLSVIAEYQVELFWIALVFNLAGILYILSKVVSAARAHTKS